MTTTSTKRAKNQTAETSDQGATFDVEEMKPTRIVQQEEPNMGSVEPQNKKLGIFKIADTVKTPVYGTQDAACFDIACHLDGVESVKVFTPQNEKITRYVETDVDGTPYILIRPFERVLIPTGLVLDIPTGYFVELNPRSSTPLKEGLTIANCTGIIDADYVEQLFAVGYNISQVPLKVKNGERVVQARLEEVKQVEFVVLDEKPQVKTDRVGGFGSTGKQ